MKSSIRNTSHFRARNLAGHLAAISLASTFASHAALVVTRAESYRSYVTTVTGTQTLDFNTVSTSSTINTYSWTNGSTTIGSIASLRVRTTNIWGGAGESGSNYAVQSKITSLGAPETTTLTLNESSAYFGFWWSAGDGKNVLTFKDASNQVVATFTTSTLLNALPNTTQNGYFGAPKTKTLDNPATVGIDEGGYRTTTNNAVDNYTEAYAFINFFGTAGTTWKTIEFTNNASDTAFESDNWTVRKDAWGDGPEGPTAPLPGVVVTTIPEPSSLLEALASVGFLVLRRKR